ncbi:Transposase, IS605 [Methanocaldococcus bathoardescens]|uniref:Transposase, IS605 n=1 Tax=Methanocaldococcus bathoardescens TaxID=1301915 RepID=A0A076L978_9EURY|nr:RNA-guided endonuclease TnpB family protein [Methanocaldococcus bathoardescens]AIJ04875.1 Transposase, IS605 [Methanocaldococcus bathoardescens]
MKLSLKMKIKPLRTNKMFMLEKTLIDFKNAVNDWIDISWNDGKITDRKLHSYGYKELREKYPNLYSNSLQDAMNWAIQILRSSIKLNPNKKPIFNTLMVSYKSVDYKYENEGLIIPLCGKRVFIPLYIPKKYKKYLQNGTFGRLVIKKEGNDYYAYLSIKVEEKEPYKPTLWFGVDLGVYNLVVVADSKGREILRFDGEIVKEYKKKLEKYRARIQSRQKRNFNKYTKVGNKISNYSKYINHVISKEIVKKAKQYNAGIVLEKLKGLKKSKLNKSKPKNIRKALHIWSYADLIKKIKYKAKLEGVPVVEISPRNTSKTCSRCGYVNRRLKNERIFVCPKCGLEIDRDLNASINIAKKVASKQA